MVDRVGPCMIALAPLCHPHPEAEPMAKEKAVWTRTVVFLAASPKRGTSSRDGYKDQNGQVALPPVRGGQSALTIWLKKMGIYND